MNWFPSNNHPSDKATYTMHITVPAELTAAANGVLTDVTENDDATRTFVWQMDEPMASYLTIVAIGDYVEVRDDSGPVPIRNYFPKDADASLISGFGITQQIMAWLIETVGPYPFAEYGVVIVPGFPAALETQSLSIFRQRRARPNGDHARTGASMVWQQRCAGALAGHLVERGIRHLFHCASSWRKLTESAGYNSFYPKYPRPCRRQAISTFRSSSVLAYTFVAP